MEIIKTIAELIVTFLQVIMAFMAVVWLYFSCIRGIKDAKLRDLIAFLILSGTTASLTWLLAVLNTVSSALGSLILAILMAVILIVIDEIKTRL